jgi:hypothetical protein
MVNGPLLDGRGNHLPAQIRINLSFIAEDRKDSSLRLSCKKASRI